MIKIEIKNRWTGSIIFTYEKENNTLKDTIKEYIRQECEVNGKYRANLTRANLTDANLLIFKSDLWRILLMYKKEVPGLINAIKDGQINGSTYTGTCACLKGTIANVAGCSIEKLPNITKSTSEPAEQWFLQFSEGMTPENSNAMKITLDWIEEFLMYLK